MDRIFFDSVPIYAEKCHIGVGCTIEPNVSIGSPEDMIEELYIGDHVFIGHDSVINAKKLVIQDYTKIHNHAFLYGRSEAHIGYNCWFGQNCIIDCEGSVSLGNGLGVGAYSQLWSHIRHGDISEGCRYLDFGSLIVEEDVWFVGRCTVSPIVAQKKSVALVGSVVTKDMEENRVYGGSPAKDLTEKLGPPFREISLDEKVNIVRNKLAVFLSQNSDIDEDFFWITDKPPCLEGEFSVLTRTYRKNNHPEEVRFMKFLLPEVKFVPVQETRND